MVKCPSCERDDFESEQGMKVHHYHAHGESLAYQTCDYCGEEFKDEKGHDRRYCSWGCYEDHRSEDPSSHPRWKGRVEKECPECGETFEAEPRKAERRKYCSRACHNRASFSGEGNGQWKGGHPQYYGDNWSKARQKAIDRDGGECWMCGSDDRLDVHHLIPLMEFETPEAANSLDNLVTLCRSCHVSVENSAEAAERLCEQLLDGKVVSPSVSTETSSASSQRAQNDAGGSDGD